MTSKRYARGIWWIKRDFRLHDNEALCNSIAQCDSVLPVFIIEPGLCAAEETSYFHYHAWQQAAACLQQSLSAIGGCLFVTTGEAVEVFSWLQHHCGFDALFSHEETGSNITFQRDLSVKRWCETHSIPWHECAQNGVIRALSHRDKRQPVIKQRLINTKPLPAPQRMRSWKPGHKQSVTSWPDFESVSGRANDTRILSSELQPITEAAAISTWNSFIQHRGIAYSGGISSPNTAFSAGSRLSAHLAWGTFSLRQAFHATWERQRELNSSSGGNSSQWQKSLKAFQSRLHWHDHFMQRLESAPAMEFEALNSAYRSLTYGNNDTLLEAWKTGHTGIPLLDACVRCLAATGFLNFRMRAMLVSCGCFGLAQSWQSLQYPLARLFRDYEPGIHFSQVQMQAGIVGINTIRIYNPHKQMLDHDPQAIFIKRWIPELSDFTAIEIAGYNERALGDYPTPVTDIKHNTKIIRDQVYAIRKSAQGKEASTRVLEAHGSRLKGNDRSRQARPKAARTAKTNQRASRTTLADNQLGFDFDGDT